MKKAIIKTGMIIQLSGRTAEVIAIRGDKAKIKPSGESCRWLKITNLRLAD